MFGVISCNFAVPTVVTFNYLVAVNVAIHVRIACLFLNTAYLFTVLCHLGTKFIIHGSSIIMLIQFFEPSYLILLHVSCAFYAVLISEGKKMFPAKFMHTYKVQRLCVVHIGIK
jgi:hypothetical protein